MARPKKQTVDYFPHIVKGGKTIFVLENDFGNDGYAFWFKLLELLCSTDGHVYDCRNPAAWRFLVAKTRVSEETAEKILETLCDLDAIDKELWAQRMIWIQNLVDNVGDAYKKRKQGLPQKPSFRHQEPEQNEVSDTGNSDNEEFSPQAGDGNPQIKLNKIKLNNNTFEHLWRLYPRKLGKGGITDAQKKKLHDIGIEHLERCIKRFTAHMQQENRLLDKYPYGSTFFNSGYVDYMDENYSEGKPRGQPQPNRKPERDLVKEVE